MDTILTGIRVNSDMTLGNYLGALVPMVRLANKYSKTHHINIFVPDLHTITDRVIGGLQENLISSIKYYLSAGLELNQNVHFYRQSKVPAHTEMMWILGCFSSMGELSRMTQYKDKAETSGASLGLFSYPVLMASDILLYSAKYVPVGEDQFQHIELTRDLGERINNKLGEVFVLPEKTSTQVKFMEQTKGIRIRDLTEPDKKMSKSALKDSSKIMMSDLPALAYKKITSATTDSIGKINLDFDNQPGISNLLMIMSLIDGEPIEKVTKAWENRESYGDLKKSVAEKVENFLSVIQAKKHNIDDQSVIKILEEGEKYANLVANQKLNQVKKLLSLV